MNRARRRLTSVIEQISMSERRIPQLYLEFILSDTTSRDNDIHRLELCIKDIRTWMRLNMLKLNDDKTELLFIYPK